MCQNQRRGGVERIGAEALLIRANRGDDLDKSKDGKVSYEEFLGMLTCNTFIRHVSRIQTRFPSGRGFAPGFIRAKAKKGGRRS